jgi:hypothetical protein
MIKQRFNDQGAVALITTIIISILLSIVVIGVMIVTISELRQSNDNEQSIRAYYAAESGVENAISKAMALPHTSQDCSNPTLSKNLNLDPTNLGQVGWSCQQILFTGQPSGTLSQADQAVQLDLEGAGIFHSATLEWDTGAPKNYTPVVGALPSSAAWSASNRPAALELTVVDYPKLAPFNGSDINTQNYLVLPGGGGAIAQIGAPVGSNPLRGTCTGSGTYHCKITFNGFSTTRSYMLRLRTRYVGTSYQFTFYTGANGVGLKTDVPDGTATIDVTGKAGDVYRRVVYKIPFDKGAAVGLDYVLFSDTNICKDLTIIGAAISGPPGCGI